MKFFSFFLIEGLHKYFLLTREGVPVKMKKGLASIEKGGQYKERNFLKS